METGAEITVRCLENEGVEYVFGIPGEQTIPVMEELRKSEIEFVATRHEQGAAFMADVYSRVTGRTGVCLATLGPGATNLVTGIGNASLDHSSVVALTSQRETTDQHKHSHQFININSIFEAVTKLTDSVRRPEAIPEQIRKSFEIAGREKKGATHLELPVDVTREEADVKVLDALKNRVSPSGVQETNIEVSLDIVNQAQNPVIIAGQGATTPTASEQLTQFVRSTEIPVVTTFMGKGAVSARDNRSVGTIGFGSDDHAMHAVKQADCVITIGYDYVEFHPDSWNVGTEKDIIHIDSTPPEIDKDYGVEMTLIGNVSRIIEQMKKAARQVVEPSYSDTLNTQFENKIEEEYRETEKPPFTPQQAVAAAREALNDEDILISDVGSHKYWFSRRYPTYNPGTFIVSNGFASMGISLPGAIAASLATDQNILAATGDGGFLMNVQELETAARLGVDMTIAVLDDREYTAISMEQNADYGEVYGSSFDNPDFTKLASSFGVRGHKVSEAENLVPTLNKAVSSDRIDIVSIPIEPKKSYELEEKIK